MNPIDFDGSNKILGKPNSMTEDECVPLPVFDNGEQIISVWEPTEEERIAIANGAKICLSLWTANGTHPPVGIFTHQFSDDIQEKGLRLVKS